MTSKYVSRSMTHLIFFFPNYASFALPTQRLSFLYPNNQRLGSLKAQPSVGER